MSFLFPLHTLKQINKLAEKEFAYHQLPFKQPEQQNFQDETDTFIKWLKSFLPGKNNSAYQARKEFANHVHRMLNHIKSHIRENPYKYFIIKALIIAAFPSWKKTIAIAVTTIILLALTATGIGALAGLGLFGATVAELALSKLALSLIGIVAAKIVVSPFLLAAVTTAVSGLLTSFMLSEWLEPGKLFYTFTKNQHIDFLSTEPVLEIDRNIKEPIFHLGKNFLVAIFFPIVTGFFALNSLRQLIIFSRNLRSKLNSFEQNSYDEGLNELKELIRFTLNPFYWLENLLLAVERFMFRALESFTERGEDSPLLLKISKGLINTCFQVVIIPLQLLQLIGNIPIYAMEKTFNVTTRVTSAIFTFCINTNDQDCNYQPLNNFTSSYNHTGNLLGNNRKFSDSQVGWEWPYNSCPTSVSTYLQNSQPSAHLPKPSSPLPNNRPQSKAAVFQVHTA